MPSLGEIWSDPNYYFDDSGVPQRKHFAILGLGGGDVVVRLITSQCHGRPFGNTCHQNDSYPAFHLGIIDPSCKHLALESWLDLRFADNVDDRVFATQARQGSINLLGMVPPHLMCAALLCAANANETRPRQRNRIYDARSALGCQN